MRRHLHVDMQNCADVDMQVPVHAGVGPPSECGLLGVDLQPNRSLVAKDVINELLTEGRTHNKAAWIVLTACTTTRMSTKTVCLHVQASAWHIQCRDGALAMCPAQGESAARWHSAGKDFVRRAYSAARDVTGILQAPARRIQGRNTTL